uniref:Cyp4d1-RA n=1 Tax=Drosophila melanogaster TaxID=7227 RepID=A0A0F6T2F9_DROME|nr:cytochrome P450 4d1, isoform A [Drosophila melanogaster]AAB71165.1 cytochrome P450 [Drosophila melanogaster]AAB71166.1 cytochrome P450 [Drosophila melanogaster]AAB71167.1 cytochrome P450 [Drosophila melanogaster]AAF45737.1 cytochrome P450 4d1, isoform A [Drosophila melanogaster]AKD42954.1 Cyp4d1-RA [Drosophila melanogaster]|eukprot:NP_476907.2 cytochrome P450-4d1, isoform A [Drosophila melanogaster]
MFLVIGAILASALFVGLLLYHLKFKRLIDLISYMPGPPVLPLVGHGHHFIGKPPHEMVKKIFEFMETYSKDQVLKVWLGPELNVLMGNPKDVEVVLGTLRFNDKAGEYKALEPWLKEGLLVSRGRKWHKRRKIITPAFHFKILDQFVEVFEKGSRDLLRNMEQDRLKHGDSGFSLYDWINLCTMDTICETAMGVSINAQSNADSEYVQAVKTISMVLHKRMFNILYRFDLTYMLTPLARAEKKALNVLHQFTEKIIVQRREELIREGSSQESSNDDADVGAKRKMAFLDILLQSTVDERPLSNLDIREEVDTFMFEGHDTTSSALMFFFYNIATHPEAQKKCFEEIRSVVGNDKSTPVSYELLNQLHYVDLCVKETLRMYPSVPLLGRKVLEDCEINGKLIPAGTNIGISPLYLGRREELFSEPNIFKPERFDVVTTAEKLNPYAYIPFSAGPRNCIGQKFAMLEIKAIVANVLRHYEVDFVGDSSEPPVLIAELILRTKEPLMFKVRERVY